MTWSHLNRRVHLYCGLALLPWLFMYGVSSVPFAHTGFFDRLDAAKGLPLWTLRLERPVDAAVPEDAGQLRELGRVLLREAGIEGMSYGVYRQNATQINVYAHTFWKSTQLKYFTDRRLLTVEDRRFRWDHFLTGMHARGGFEQEGWLPVSWSVVVDLVQLAILVWIASGLWMWWEVGGHRRWGVVTILGGAASFLWFMTRL
jgi:hypothetical protein